MSLNYRTLKSSILDPLPLIVSLPCQFKADDLQIIVPRLNIFTELHTHISSCLFDCLPNDKLCLISNIEHISAFQNLPLFLYLLVCLMALLSKISPRLQS